MATFTNQLYEEQSVYLDGNRYEHCTFVRCRMIFHGDELPALVDCQISDSSEWVMQHAAMRTMLFFRAMYASGNTQVVDRLMEIISGGKDKSSPQSGAPPIVIE